MEIRTGGGVCVWGGSLLERVCAFFHLQSYYRKCVKEERMVDKVETAGKRMQIGAPCLCYKN